MSNLYLEIKCSELLFFFFRGFLEFGFFCFEDLFFEDFFRVIVVVLLCVLCIEYELWVLCLIFGVGICLGESVYVMEFFVLNFGFCLLFFNLDLNLCFFVFDIICIIVFVIIFLRSCVNLIYFLNWKFGKDFYSFFVRSIKSVIVRRLEFWVRWVSSKSSIIKCLRVCLNVD